MAIRLNVDGVDRMLSSANKQRARYLAANQAMLSMEPLVPRKTGELRDSTRVSTDGSSIVYTMPYAQAQFYGNVNGHPIRNYTTAGTGPRWDLRTIADRQRMQQITDAYRKGLMK